MTSSSRQGRMGSQVKAGGTGVVSRPKGNPRGAQPPFASLTRPRGGGMKKGTVRRLLGRNPLSGDYLPPGPYQSRYDVYPEGRMDFGGADSCSVMFDDLRGVRCYNCGGTHKMQNFGNGRFEVWDPVGEYVTTVGSVEEARRRFGSVRLRGGIEA